MKAAPLPRKTANLSQSIHQQLNMYALAAGAAGVSVLALSPPGEAKIVYTPANKKITLNHTISLDLNHDGVADFAVGVYTFHQGGSGRQVTYTSMYVWGLTPSNAVVANAKNFAAALHAGNLVGPRKRFGAGKLTMAVRFSSFTTRHSTRWSRGPWLHLSRGYLGLKFKVKGEIHYGWARFTGTSYNGGTLTGYAYETVPGKAIIAGATKGSDDAEPTAALSSHTPEPVTLGALALGAPGLSIWRREEPAARTQQSN
jgi:hypothetical protein